MSSSVTREESLESLVAAARLGDRDAWDRITNIVSPGLFATAMARLRDVTNANDLVQAVLLNALRKLAQLKEGGCLMGWLRKTAIRMAINHSKRRLVLQLEDKPESLLLDPSKSPLDQLILQEDCILVHQALGSVKVLYRETLLRHYMQRQSVKRIAFEMATNTSTVKRRLFYGRSRLAVQLSLLGYEWSLCA
jgi:RNA polymerase sigma-70 factor (ECF subfamily)